MSLDFKNIVDWSVPFNGTNTKVMKVVSSNGNTVLWHKSFPVIYHSLGQFTPTYTVIFNLNGGKGTTPDSITVSYNSTINSLPESSPSTFYYEGASFGGWYTDATSGSLFEANKTKVTENIILYARWNKGSLTISFDGNGATSGNMTSIPNLEYNQEITIPTCQFKKTNSEFTSWSTKLNNENQTFYQNSIFLMPNHDVSLTAQWSEACEIYYGDVPAWLKKGSNYGITFSANKNIALLHFDSNSTSVKNPQKALVHTAQSNEYIRTIIIHEDIKNHDHGFVIKSSKDEYNNMSSNSKRISRQVWSHSWYQLDSNNKVDWPNRLYVECESRGGTSIYKGQINSDYPSNIEDAVCNDKSFQEKTIQKGQTILYSTISYSNVAYNNKTDIFESTKIEYPSTYNSSSPPAFNKTSTTIDSNLYYTSKQGSNEHIKFLIIKNPTDEIIEKYKYKTDDQLLADTTVIQLSYTSTPLTITYYINNDNSDSKVDNVQEGELISLAASNLFSYSGYKFTSWNTKADGSGTSYNSKESVTIYNNMTLYAQWQIVSSSEPPEEKPTTTI